MVVMVVLGGAVMTGDMRIIAAVSVVWTAVYLTACAVNATMARDERDESD
jgi:hypothetical protein